jgi:hypothetical protein
VARVTYHGLYALQHMRSIVKRTSRSSRETSATARTCSSACIRDV